MVRNPVCQLESVDPVSDTVGVFPQQSHGLGDPSPKTKRVVWDEGQVAVQDGFERFLRPHIVSDGLWEGIKYFGEEH